MHTLVNDDSGHQAPAVKATPNLTWFKEKGEFISDYTMQVGQPHNYRQSDFHRVRNTYRNPAVKGIETRGLSDKRHRARTGNAAQKASIIVGGGYIGMEYGHFFSAIGTKTTIIQRPLRVVPDEEPEISELLKKEMAKRMEIYTGLRSA